MSVLIGGEVERADDTESQQDFPEAERDAQQCSREQEDDDENGSVPPCHPYRSFVRVSDAVIACVRFEYAVVGESMFLVGVAKPPHRLVHDEFMQRPLKEG